MKLRTLSLATLALLVAALLAACGLQDSAQQPLATANSAPSSTAAAVEPSAEATAAPEATIPPLPIQMPTPLPAGETALPRALYTLQAGQIFRIEPDGVTRTQITYEVPYAQDALAVVDFAVSPADGSLIYMVQRAGPAVLVRSGPDGQGVAPFFDDPIQGPSEPLFTPDGTALAVRLVGQPNQGATRPDGLYLLPLDGGEPRLLAADELDPASATGGLGQAPAAFSPDGTRLLTYRIGLGVDICDLGVLALAEGSAVAVQAPPAPADERVTTCGPAAWAPDGSSIYFTSIRVGAPGSTGIWRADPASGESFPITPQPASAPYTLYEAPTIAADGSLRAFVASVDELPVPFGDPPARPQYAMATVGLSDGLITPLRAPSQGQIFQPRWDPDGRGAVVLLSPAVGDPALVWLPVGEGEPLLLESATTDLFAYEWAAR